MTENTFHTSKGCWRLIGSMPENLTISRFDEAMAAARRAKANAYAPYSKFLVGASALMDGNLVSGCNVENASYGGTICAERSAIFSGISDGHRNLQLVAVSTSAETGTPMENRAPCGLCRQVISEFANAGTIVLLDSGPDSEKEFVGEVIAFDALLPWQFQFSGDSNS